MTVVTQESTCQIGPRSGRDRADLIAATPTATARSPAGVAPSRDTTHRSRHRGVARSHDHGGDRDVHVDTHERLELGPHGRSSASPDDIGEQISGLFRRSVLGAGQKSCLGQVKLNDFGEQGVVAAIATESPGDDDEFVEGLRAAADFCNIDPSAIFG